MDSDEASKNMSDIQKRNDNNESRGSIENPVKYSKEKR
jgi:hypothetical protein